MSTQFNLLKQVFEDVISLRENYQQSAQNAQMEEEQGLKWYFQGKVDLAQSLVIYLGELLKLECEKGE